MKTYKIIVKDEDDKIWSYGWGKRLLRLSTHELAQIMRDLYHTPKEYFASFKEDDKLKEFDDVVAISSKDLSKMSFENVLDVLYKANNEENNIYNIDDSSHKLSRYLNRYCSKHQYAWGGNINF